MRSKRSLLSVLLLLAVVSACSTPSTTSDSASSAGDNSLYPSWYSSSGFMADSLMFTSFGTALNSDSLESVHYAEEHARVLLDRMLGEKIEGIRSSLEDSGNQDVTNTDYYIILREAQSALAEQAKLASTKVLNQDNGSYRAFVSLELTKTAAREKLEAGFNGHPRYWGALSGSTQFDVLFN